MKLIAFCDPSDLTFHDILRSVDYGDDSRFAAFSDPEEFKEAVRKNIVPRPVIIFSASDQSQLHHITEIKEYIADTILLLIVPDEDCYHDIQKEGSLRPRYVFYRNDDRHLLSAMLNKLNKRQRPQPGHFPKAFPMKISLTTTY